MAPKRAREARALPRVANTNARFTSSIAHVNSPMSISEEQVKNALKSVKYPGFTRDIISFGLVKSIQIDNGDVKVQLALATNDPNIPATIKNDAEHALRAIESFDRYPCASRRRRGGHGHHADSWRPTRYRGGER